MEYRDVVGQWRINANGFIGRLQLWMNARAAEGRLWLDAHQVWETLTAVSFANDQLQFTRGGQRYTGTVRLDGMRGQFTHNLVSYPWSAARAWPAETRLERERPRVRFLTTRPGPPNAPRVLVLVEERLTGYLLAETGGGWTPFTRWLDDLQNEGWDVHVYRYDVRSDQTGEPGHRHLPSEVLQLYRTIREFYLVADTRLSGVVLIGDFPAAGTCHIDTHNGVAGTQAELDYFCVDAMLADPFGYWEWLPVAPMVPPGSPSILRTPADEGLPPNGALYPRGHWNAPGFVHTRQWEVHHSERDATRYGSDPKFWVGRVGVSQAAWRTGQHGWEWSEAEEVRLLLAYFDRNHQHRTAPRTRRGYIFIEKDWAGGWQVERTRMAAAIPQTNIVVHADTAGFAGNQKASIANYLGSLQQEHLVCQYEMHSDFLNHYFSAESGQDVLPVGFPTSYTSPGSPWSVAIPPGGSSIKEIHLIAAPNKHPLPRFYLLGGCDVARILTRPRFLVDGEKTSPATPLSRQYGAHMLATAYLAHLNGLAILAHNVTNPPSDYTTLFASLEQNKPFGEAVLALMRAENAARLPHYRNVVFGDPTLRLNY